MKKKKAKEKARDEAVVDRKKVSCIKRCFCCCCTSSSSKIEIDSKSVEETIGGDQKTLVEYENLTKDDEITLVYEKESYHVKFPNSHKSKQLLLELENKNFQRKFKRCQAFSTEIYADKNNKELVRAILLKYLEDNKELVESILNEKTTTHNEDESTSGNPFVKDSVIEPFRSNSAPSNQKNNYSAESGISDKDRVSRPHHHGKIKNFNDPSSKSEGFIACNGSPQQKWASTITSKKNIELIFSNSINQPAPSNFEEGDSKVSLKCEIDSGNNNNNVQRMREFHKIDLVEDEIEIDQIDFDLKPQTYPLNKESYELNHTSSSLKWKLIISPHKK